MGVQQRKKYDTEFKRHAVLQSAEPGRSVKEKGKMRFN
ncbi:MAG: transposase [Desulforhopalus sp.]